MTTKKPRLTIRSTERFRRRPGLTEDSQKLSKEEMISSTYGRTRKGRLTRPEDTGPGGMREEEKSAITSIGRNSETSSDGRDKGIAKSRKRKRRSNPQTRAEDVKSPDGQKRNKTVDTYGSMKVESIVTRGMKNDRQVLAIVLSDIRGLGDGDSGILMWVHSGRVSDGARRMRRDERRDLVGV